MSEDAVRVAEAAPETDAPEAQTRAPVGSRLKAERTRQGLVIADVAHRLKYSPRQIEAVEADDYAALPGLTFVRGFVRGYARLLGIPADPLVAALEEEAAERSGPTTVQLQSVTPTRTAFPVPGARPMRAMPWLLATLAVVVGVGGYALIQWEAPSAVSAPPSAAVPAPAVAVKPNTIIVDSGPAQGATGAAMPPGDAGSAAPPAGPSGGLPATPAAVAQASGGTESSASPGQGRIRLVFSGESWTEVRDAEGKVVLSRNNAPGSEQWADGQPPFDLVVGNAREVRLFYRGTEVDLLPYIKVSVARLTLK